VHPTGLVDPTNPRAAFVILAGEALRGNGGIFVSTEGKRFVNELGYRDHLSAAILKVPLLCMCFWV
jgi:FAD-dependent fumarate reductase